MEKLKQQILSTINKDGKDIDELVSILKWALIKAQNLQDLKDDMVPSEMEMEVGITDIETGIL